MVVLTEYLCTSVTYLGFCYGGYMILSSIPAFIARGLKLDSENVCIFYTVYGGPVSMIPLIPPPPLNTPLMYLYMIYIYT